MVPKGWRKSNFGELAFVKSGFAFKSTDFVEKSNNTCPIVRMSDLKNGQLALDSAAHIPKEVTRGLERFLLSEGDFVFGMTGSLENNAFVFVEHLPCYLNQRVGKLVAKNGDYEFTCHLFRSKYFSRKIDKLAAGAAQKNISSSDIESLTVLVPPFPEQKKIARILSTWDKAIETIEKLIENSQQQKKALMQQLLTGKKRLSGFSGEWNRVQLNDCAESLDNLRIPLNSDARSKMKGNIPYYGANGILDYVNEYIFDETIVLLAEDGGNFKEFASKPIANIVYGKSWVNNHAHVLRAKDNTTNEWIYYLLVHKNIMGFVGGGTRAKLNKANMLKIPMLLPSLEEQNEIVKILSVIDREINLLESDYYCLNMIKQALMQQLLTGKRRVKIDEEDRSSASVE